MAEGTPAAEEVRIRVRLDTVQANQDVKEVMKGVGDQGSSIASLLFRGVTGVASGVLGAVFGEMTHKAAGTFMGDFATIGRATSAGQFWEQRAAMRSAEEKAREQTAEMFGMVGNTARIDQVRGVYHQLLSINQQEAMGRQRVEHIIDAERSSQKIFENIHLITEAVKGAGTLLEELVNIVRNGSRSTGNGITR